MGVLGILLGFISGLFSGLIPGIHSTTLISFMHSLGIPENELAYSIPVIMSVYAVLSFIPALFFGAPDENTAAASLPGRVLVSSGYASQALFIVAVSSLLSAGLSLLMFYPAITFYSLAFQASRGVMPFIIAFASSLLIFFRTRNPYTASLVFLVSGIIGAFSFSLSLPDPFLPMFGGFFAIPFAFSFFSKASGVPKKEKNFRYPELKYVIYGVLAGLVADFLPGISSPSQMAMLLSFLVPFRSAQYLSSVVSISVSESVFSFATSVSSGKARIGEVAWLGKFSDISSLYTFHLLLFCLFLSLSASLLIFLSKRHNSLISIFSGNTARMFSVMLVASISYLSGGIYSILVLVLSSLLGFACSFLGVERTMLMGSIIVPTFFLYS